MNSKDILQSDLLDIVFDKRNKSYGAYELRKHYRRRLFKSLAIAFVLAAGIGSTVMFVKNDMATGVESIPETYIVKIFEEPKPLEIKPLEPKKKEPVKLAAAPKPVAKQRHTSHIEITKNPLEASKINTLVDNMAIGSRDSEGELVGKVIVPAPTTIDAGGNAVESNPKVDNTTPRLTADVMPSYPGGMSALKKFMEKNLRPFDDIDQGKIISVKITFVVGYDGKLKSFQILEDGGDAYSKEVIRVLKKMPEWVPGKANGENVSVYYTIPVKFTAAE